MCTQALHCFERIVAFNSGAMQDGQQHWGNSMPNQASTEDAFLKAPIEDETLVSVFMINGMRLSGHVASFDRHIVMPQSLTIARWYSSMQSQR
ncbi:RNA chaperone Hfq [Paraburkholderia sediminicola]|uniref:RNA chaperone Hfq n=2 Tax=Paraburkholderia sediminicola TaxID=458836 RepID=UPI0038B9E365